MDKPKEVYLASTGLTVGKLKEALSQWPDDTIIYANAQAAHEEDQFDSILLDEANPDKTQICLTVFYGW